MKNTRGEPSAGGQTAPRETSLSLCLFIPCRSLHCGTRCKHSNYAQVAPSGRVFKIQKKSRTIFDQINAVTH